MNFVIDWKYATSHNLPVILLLLLDKIIIIIILLSLLLSYIKLYINFRLSEHSSASPGCVMDSNPKITISINKTTNGCSAVAMMAYIVAHYDRMSYYYYRRHINCKTGGCFFVDAAATVLPFSLSLHTKK